MGKPSRGWTGLSAGLAGIVVVVVVVWLQGTNVPSAPEAEAPAGRIVAVDPVGDAAGHRAGAVEGPSPMSSPPLVAGARYRLLDVVAGTSADGGGVALIAIDGAAGRAFPVGAAIDGGLVLLGVSPGGAILGPPNGPPVLVLEVPQEGPPAPAAAMNAARSPAAQASETQALAVPVLDLQPTSQASTQAPGVKPAPARRTRLRSVSTQP